MDRDAAFCGSRWIPELILSKQSTKHFRREPSNGLPLWARMPLRHHNPFDSREANILFLCL